MPNEEITPEQFRTLCGRAPEQDDLERANCPEAGMPGHGQCGRCPEHRKPRFECGCSAIASEPNHEPDLDLADPEDLRRYAKQIETLKIDALFDPAAGRRDPYAEQHLAIALELLGQAQHHVKLAALFQARSDAARHIASGPDP